MVRVFPLKNRVQFVYMIGPIVNITITSLSYTYNRLIGIIIYCNMLFGINSFRSIIYMNSINISCIGSK